MYSDNQQGDYPVITWASLSKAGCPKLVYLAGTTDGSILYTVLLWLHWTGPSKMTYCMIKVAPISLVTQYLLWSPSLTSSISWLNPMGVERAVPISSAISFCSEISSIMSWTSSTSLERNTGEDHTVHAKWKLLNTEGVLLVSYSAPVSPCWEAMLFYKSLLQGAKHVLSFNVRSCE